VSGIIVYTVTANIVASPTGDLVNTATVAVPTGYSDPTPANNSSTDTDTLLSADLSIVKTDGQAGYSAGGSVSYTVTVTNVSGVTVTGATVSDTRPANILNWAWACTSQTGGASGCTAAASGTSNFSDTVDLPVSGIIVYTVTANIVASPTGDLVNTATVAVPTGYSDPTPANNSSTDTDTLITSLIGVAKRMVATPVLVSPGTWDVTFEILVKNYSSVALSALQVTDNLTSTFPLPTTFTVRSVTSTAFTENLPGYNGSSNINLLTGVDTLAVEGQGTITLVVRIIPASSGPFYNTAVASAAPPTGDRVSDSSTDGTDPDSTTPCTAGCVNGDNDPTNNTKATPVTFTAHLFDPPFGVKVINESGLPELEWTMVWINGSNLVAVNAAVNDEIPLGTTYVTGSLSCSGASSLTITTSCAFEVPGITPRGRILWTGEIGPDFGATDAATAINELYITFRVTVNPGVISVQNEASIDSDLDGNGSPTDPGEIRVATASASWPSEQPAALPATGFAPGRVTTLPLQDAPYADLGNLWLEVPRLGVKMPIVGVPQSNGEWNVTWLGDQAGWLNGTAFPTWEGNSVITGHVYDAFGRPAPFVHLNWLWYGDKIIVHAWGGEYVYEVRQVKSVLPEALSTALKHEDLPWVTLVTCRGYDEASNSYKYRVLVRAVLVEVK
jgi:LPXTG-site transpeptidase (sortase) family protein